MSEKLLIDKGGQMEEILRDYFLELGYFVVRGPKYTFRECEITDVDLWLYQRTSSFSRERFNVDAKNRRTPQAMERILWAKGLQQCLRLDGALVATTDTRQVLKDFGDQSGVVVLDGILLSKLKKRYLETTSRLSEEEWTTTIRGNKNDRVGADWIARTAIAKSRILSQLDFDGCNAHLNDTKYFTEQVFAVRHRREIACRLFYLTLSLTLVTLDFIVRDFAFIERQLQADALNDGLRFGTLGKQGAEKVFSTAAKIASAYLRGQNVRPADLLKQLRNESMKFPVEILAEFFLKFNQGKALFDMARSFEGLAFGKEFKPPTALASEHRGLIGAVLDFHQVERKKFFDAITEEKKVIGGPLPTETQTISPQQEFPIESPPLLLPSNSKSALPEK